MLVFNSGKGLLALLLSLLFRVRGFLHPRLVCIGLFFRVCFRQLTLYAIHNVSTLAVNNFSGRLFQTQKVVAPKGPHPLLSLGTPGA